MSAHRRNQRRFPWLATLALGWIALAFLGAQTKVEAKIPDGEEAARAYIAENHGRLLEILKRPKSPKRDREIGELLQDFLDYERISETSLGAGWGKLKPTEQERFQSLLGDLIERNYIASLEDTKHFAIRYLDSRKDEGSYIVETEARDRKNRRAPPIRMSYRLVERGPSFRVIDIVTDGVSLVTNYRNQFSRILARDGFEALIAKMEERLESG